MINQDRIIGFAIGLGFLFLMGSIPAQVNNNFTNEPSLYNELSNIYQTMQTKKWRVDISSPNLQSLNDRESMFVSSSDVKMVIRIGSTLYYSPAFK